METVSSAHRSVRGLNVAFRLVYHDGQQLLHGPTTTTTIKSTDSADAITTRVMKAFGLPSEAHSLMHFTTPEPAGKRVVPTFYGINGLDEVYLHIMDAHKNTTTGSNAGAKRSREASEGSEAVEMVREHLKRICLENRSSL